MDAAMLVSHLVSVRVELAVCRNYSVAVEGLVSRVIVVEVASECENMVCTIYGSIHRPFDCLVLEVPDESALVFWIFSDEVPVFLEASH